MVLPVRPKSDWIVILQNSNGWAFFCSTNSRASIYFSQQIPYQETLKPPAHTTMTGSNKWQSPTIFYVYFQLSNRRFPLEIAFIFCNPSNTGLLRIRKCDFQTRSNRKCDVVFALFYRELAACYHLNSLGCYICPCARDKATQWAKAMPLMD